MKSLYTRRAERLQQLAVDHPLGDYLNFAASIAQAQNNACHDNPLELDLGETLTQSAASGKPPLDISVYPRSEHWHKLLASLIAELRPQAPEHVLAVLDNLEKSSSHELETAGQRPAERRVCQSRQRQSPVPLGGAVVVLGADGQPESLARHGPSTASIANSARFAAVSRFPAWCILVP